ncbi:MBL fold metallo-hydrolase [Luteolibacter sp. Populi]|uniref:MBL fold metallo-hydrolase n=1 Tax=Luteolibacter sp. Populi TaxID=3230487 RepID=UPI003467AE94
MRGGTWKGIEFPALVGLIRHPTLGFLLYDTGYSPHFMEATRGFPECLYRMLTPTRLDPEEELLRQLEERRIAPDQIHAIIISHLHADHVAGLRDFPKTRFIGTRAGYQEMRKLGRLRALAKAYLPALVPADFEQRLDAVEDAATLDPGLLGFRIGYDLLGDGSAAAVLLPGHTGSHLGLHFTDTAGRRIFLLGDACWQMEALEKRRLPSRIANLLFTDPAAYAATFHKLADLHAQDPGLVMIPSHCSRTWEEQKHGTKRLAHA